MIYTEQKLRKCVAFAKELDENARNLTIRWDYESDTTDNFLDALVVHTYQERVSDNHITLFKRLFPGSHIFIHIMEAERNVYEANLHKGDKYQLITIYYNKNKDIKWKN